MTPGRLTGISRFPISIFIWLFHGCALIMAKDKKTETLDDSKTSESSPKGVPGQTFPDKKASLLRLTAQAEFLGPFPASSELERYEKIYPGMAKALLD